MVKFRKVMQWWPNKSHRNQQKAWKATECKSCTEKLLQGTDQNFSFWKLHLRQS